MSLWLLVGEIKNKATIYITSIIIVNIIILIIILFQQSWNFIVLEKPKIKPNTINPPIKNNIHKRATNVIGAEFSVIG